MSFVEYFGMKKDPFTEEISSKDLIVLPGTATIKQRMEYLIRSGGVMAVTGDVGIGKSTSLRYGVDQFHKTELNCIYVTATTAGVNELYKQIAWGLGCNISTSSRAYLLKSIRQAIIEMINQHRGKILIIIDEASLLRNEVMAELHTITQFDFDSKNLFSLILAGQSSLLDKFHYRTSAPLASRVVTRVHLEGIDRPRMRDYLEHHLKISGLKKNIFSENAVSAIHLNSQGLLRRANFLARGALLACMIENETLVNEEHVRLASTELM